MQTKVFALLVHHKTFKKGCNILATLYNAITKKVRAKMQASKIRLLQKIEGVTMFDKVRNTAI